MDNEIIKNELKIISQKLNIPYIWLYKIIKFESNFNPFIKNKFSSARGLIQFIDSTAQGLGYKNSLDLVNKNPSILKQLKNPVLKYFKRKAPFVNKQDFYLSVFYPRYRKKSPFTHFPDHVKKVNPGIKTINDYINKIDRVVNVNEYKQLLLLGFLGLGIIYYVKKRKRF